MTEKAIVALGGFVAIYIMKELNVFEKLKVSLLDHATYMVELAHIKIDCDLNPRLMFAVRDYLQNNLKDFQLTKVDDTPMGLQYGPEYGRYFLEPKQKNCYVYIVYESDEITLRMVPYKSEILKNAQALVGMAQSLKPDLNNFLRDVLDTYNNTCKKIWFANAKNTSWNFSYRLPTGYANLTADMNLMLSDVAQFKNNEGIYKTNGHSYRRGYLIHGPTGTGKSAIGEIIAKKYNMTVYQLQLNSKDLEDNDLKLLISKMVPNSILFVDEVEKQIESMKKQKIAHVTMAGVLSAIDGPQKMSHGSIVIMTSNKKTFLPQDEEAMLLRPGRIDKVFNFQQPF